MPDPGAAGTAGLAEPHWGEWNTGQPNAPVEASCDTVCDGGFDPFGWLARLFDAETAEGDETAGPVPVRLLPPEAPTPTGLPAEPNAGESAAAPLPAEPDAPEVPAHGEDPSAGDLRTDEVVARIWIAPFVDANGVYREAAWVRAVLAPADWRLK